MSAMGGVTAAGGVAVRRWARWPRLGAMARSRLSVRTHVVGLILVIVMPLLAFSAFLVLRSADHEQEFMAATVRERTRAAAAAIDHELGSLRTRLFMLAASHSLQTGDLAAFRSEAVAAVTPDGLSLTLVDPSGQELINTRAGPEARLPMTQDMEAVRRASESRLPDVSDLTRDALTGEWCVAINVPVFRDGKLAYLLGLNIAPLLPRMLKDLHLPDDWLVNVADRQGYTIDRSLDAGEYVGRLGRPDVLAVLRKSDEGWLPLVSRDGIPIYNAFAHVRFSGWIVSVGIPDVVLFGPVRFTTSVLVLAGIATLVVGVLLAILIGRRIARAITALVGYAEIVGRGESIGSHDTGIIETNAVVQSLRRASERLQQSAQERAVLLDRTVTAQEAERKRIARELHDSLGQYLTALRLGFANIEPLCADNLLTRQRLAELKDLAGDIGSELNRIAWELRPRALDHLSLRRAAIQFLEDWADRSGVQIDLEVGLDDRRLPPTVETAVFRVLQEAITNVVKHSGADRVAVVLNASDREVSLIVEDDGKGFDAADGSAELALGIGHLGLLGLRERLALVGGSLEVESTPRSGTTVYARIPL
jgi:signal transduction histidine kinase